MLEEEMLGEGSGDGNAAVGFPREGGGGGGGFRRLGVAPRTKRSFPSIASRESGDVNDVVESREVEPCDSDEDRR
jgi:hypothetical protein